MTTSAQTPVNSGFGLKTEPHEILEGVDLTGRTMIVTGGYSGIGLETTRALAGAGARVIVPVRSPEKAATNLKSIDGAVETAAMDLGDLGSVHAFAEAFLNDNDALHGLINNAGIMACPETRIGRGWEAQFATNHVGHFALANRLAPALVKAGETHERVRVVSLSSVGHKRAPVLFDDIHFEREPYEKWTAYGQAKTANALFAVEFDRRFRDRNVRAFAVHPGGIMTPLQRHLETEEMVALGWLKPDGSLSELAANLFKSPSQGATTTLWCAVSPQLDGKGGVYCEDCDIAVAADGDTPRWLGVAPHAPDPAAAARLWDISEQMIA